MPLEIEAKMRLTDRAALRRRLTELDAEHVADLEEVNTFFDTPDGSLRASDQGLRIRLETDTANGVSRAIVTHKGPRAHGKLKTRQESQVDVADGRAAAQLLTALGYVAVVSFEKRRQRWRLDDCLVELDAVPYLGDFVEVEGPSESAVETVRDRLGLANEPVLSASYISMLMTFLAENEIRTDHIGFDEAPGDAALAG